MPGDGDDKPGPGEELNLGPPTTPRPAASVIVLRGGSATLEVLLVKRNPSARFMGGAWVFPGGAIGPGDGAGEPAQRVAGARELAEEAGLEADPESLVPFSRWITPEQVTIRYDTYFFLHRADAAAEPQVDGGEVVDHGWFDPRGRARRASRGADPARVPDHQAPRAARRPSPTVDALLDHARGQEVRPVQPKVVRWGETERIVLPGDPGYEEA